ncbi:hypothetical protein CN229_32085 [Sinorhizobium meliloti]|nr:hypothetical protein CN229_32085 [Sinorhizobium meliloti]RVI74128.1 hypothetical protein CN191_23355 [Sinorhizobium meliloti]RVL94359.1 hypothetical protein CN131_09060 [Sinorhizobium meliloti]
MCGPSSRCRDLLPVLTGRRGKRRASSHPVAVEEQEGPASPFAPLAGRRCRQGDGVPFDRRDVRFTSCAAPHPAAATFSPF